MIHFNQTCEYINNRGQYIENYENSMVFIDFLYAFFVAFGFILTYWGNVYIKNVLYILGFIPGFYFGYYVLSIIAGDYINCYNLILFSGFSGLITTCLAVKFISIAYSCLGFLVGSSIGNVLYILLLHRINIGTTYIYANSYLLTEFISGLTGLYIFYKTKTEQLMIFTSFVGPYEILVFSDKIIQKNTNDIFNINITEKYVDDDINIGNVKAILYGILYVFLSFSGLYVQHKRHYKRVVNSNSYIRQPHFEAVV